MVNVAKVNQSPGGVVQLWQWTLHLHSYFVLLLDMFLLGVNSSINQFNAMRRNLNLMIH